MFGEVQMQKNSSIADFIFDLEDAGDCKRDYLLAVIFLALNCNFLLV
jgi:hypothetical protein